eukprot:TRINITY_DN26660_c0_g1_i2.p1 TRINITY_DN26660_c0_g1~~TRINITY_DN26660_c0_g1_i2.p1  ORF type:complete len:633 (+),score=95.20 TRINITY_DN26660_c0_g1_i2:177-1901(+)
MVSDAQDARFHRLCIGASVATLVVTAAHAGLIHWSGGVRLRQSLVLDVVMLPVVCSILCTRSARKLMGMKRWASSGDLNLVALYESWALSSLFSLFTHIASTSGGCSSVCVYQFVVLNVAFSAYEYMLKDWAPCDLCWRYAAASCYELYLSQQAFLEGVMFVSSTLAISAIGRLEATHHARLLGMRPFRKFLSAKVMMSVLFAQPVALDVYARNFQAGWVDGEKELLNLRALVFESMLLAFFNVTAFPPAEFDDSSSLALPVAPAKAGWPCCMMARLGCRFVGKGVGVGVGVAGTSPPPTPERSPSVSPSTIGRSASGGAGAKVGGGVSSVKQELKGRRWSRMNVYSTLIFWAIFFYCLYVLPRYDVQLRSTDGTCASLPTVMHATALSEDLFVFGEDRSFYHCDAVRYQCAEGFVGAPIAICSSDGIFRVSHQCSAHVTRSGCRCLPTWSHCARFGYWDCADYHGCEMAKGTFTTYEWCLTTPECSMRWDRCDVRKSSEVADTNVSDVPRPPLNRSRAAMSPWRRGVKNTSKALRHVLQGDFGSARESLSASSFEGVMAETAHATFQALSRHR